MGSSVDRSVGEAAVNVAAKTVRVVSAAVGIAVVLASCGQEGGTQRRPNVIVVLTDDQGYGDLGAHGNDRIRTPHLDRFAAQGVEFTSFYVSPVCAPTRASLLTGRYYYRTGIIHTSRGGAKMHADEVTLAERLQAAGYRTGIFGKWHLGDNYPMRPMDQGFEESLIHKSGGINQTPDRPNDYFDSLLWKNGKRFEAKGYCTDVFFDAALAFIEKNRNEPFFAYIPTNAPHTPLIVPDEYARPYLDAGLDKDTAKVYAMVENIDDNFGRLQDKLVELGLRENTLVVFLSDNGPQQRRYTAGLRGRKASTYEGGIRAISLWQWTAVLAAPAKLGSIAAHIDVTPTLMEAAGVEPDGEMDGLSLLPLLSGEPAGPDDRSLFFQCHRGLTPKRYQNAAVRSGAYKLVLGPGTFSDEAWSFTGAPPTELYDLSTDPGEEKDIAEERPEIAKDLRARYEAWFEDVRGTRSFEPGVIHIGSRAETVSVLSRYQDSKYAGGRPTTWKTLIERAGRYEVRVKREEEAWWEAPATIYLSLNGVVQAKDLEPGSDHAFFDMPLGDVELDVWAQAPGSGREIVTDNSAVGNVVLRRVE